MKSYRIQIRHKGMYYDELISGEDEEAALVGSTSTQFFKDNSSGQ